jgi:hypothetical protein
MSTLHARVQGGQIVVEQRTDLPERTQLTLFVAEADDEMTPEERAALEAELERGRAAIAAGHVRAFKFAALFEARCVKVVESRDRGMQKKCQTGSLGTGLRCLLIRSSRRR